MVVVVFTVQVGSLIVFVEYDRQRRKDIRKQKKEAAERHGILERAREEREVCASLAQLIDVLGQALACAL